MSPRRSRLRDLLSGASNADRDIEMARLRAERDSKNVATGWSAIRDLVPGVGGIISDTVKRDEDKKEKLRLEGREDQAMIAKLTREESREKAKVEREANEKKRLEERADADNKAKREIDIDKELAEQNLKGFAQQDARANAEAERDLKRELAKGKGGGRPKDPLVEEKKRVDLERAKVGLEKDTNAPLVKKQEATRQVDNFVMDLKDNIKTLRKQISDTGTFELVGPESKNAERLVNNIAVGLAKLADPESVAREGEVALARKGLIDTEGPGAFFTRNSTALSVLDALEAEIEQKRANAFRVRGLNAAPDVDEDTAAFNSAFGGQ